MKTICLLLVALAASAGYAAEGKRLPPLFGYKEAAPVAPPNDPKVVFGRLPFGPDLARVKFVRERASWVDSSPVVVWASGLKNGLFVSRLGDGHISFLSSKRNVLVYRRRW